MYGLKPVPFKLKPALSIWAFVNVRAKALTYQSCPFKSPFRQLVLTTDH
jgi:hypothetical protein